MFLKRLEAHGFKSFAHRISFDFQPGINGVVGPNGCGKSNVVDAIKWTLGEMSAKTLRGDEMLDVIFKGAAGVAPMGYAEVTLAFDNSDRRLPIEFDEVVITRRLHRTAESEYFLNKAPCRLKDIRELFYGTGVGKDCYSVIAQGRISAIVDASPRERRTIFEEAAGISKYRAQKREAEAKLERVGQDLQVLGAQVTEIAREIRSLKIQAGRAERYRQIETEVRDKRTTLALYEYHGASQGLAAVRSRLAALEADRAAVAEALASARAAVAAADAEVREREGVLAGFQADKMSAVQQAATLEEGLRLGQQRQGELAQDRDRIAAERGTQDTQVQQTGERLAAARAEWEQAETEVADARARLLESEQMLVQADAACAEIRAAVEKLQAESLEAGRKRAQHQNEVVECQTGRRGVAAQRQKAAENLARLEADFEAVRQSNDALSSDLGQRDLSMAEAREAAAREESRDGDLRAELAALAADRERLRETRNRALSREELLLGLEAQLEGLGTGAKALLRSPDHDGGPIPGIVGTVADLLRVEPGCVAAIENLLGERAGWLVAENAAIALDAVERVRAQGLQWVGVIPRNVQAGEPPRLAPDIARRFAPSPAPAAGTPPGSAPDAGPTEGPLPDGPADPVLERLADTVLEQVTAPDLPPSPAQDPESLPFAVRPAEAVVQTDPGNAAVARWCLRGYWVVPDRAAAIEFLRIAPPGTGVVTLDGLVFGPEGTVGGGAREGAVSILSRRAELATLAQELSAVTGELEAKTARAAEVEAALQRVGSALTAYRTRCYEISVEAGNYRTRLEESRKNEELLAREIEMDRREQDALVQQDAFLLERERGLQAVMAELDALDRALAGELGSRNAERSSYEKSREEIMARISDRRVAHGNADAARRAAGEAVARLQEALAEARAAVERTAAQMADIDRRHAECAAAVEAQRAALVEARAGLDRLEAQIRTAAAGRDASAARLQAEREKETVADTQDRAFEKEIGEQRLQEQERALRLDNLVRAAQDECRVDLAQAYAAGYQAPEGFDAAALHEEINELRRRLESLGTVNLAAIDDLKDREERHAQLAAQEQDLQGGKQKLEELIRRINRESREMFAATFEKVRENFRDIFRRLFGGGSADILLEENVDLLEAGIDINARPPQKDFTKLHLLSGGEKTLTTLALVMAIFKTNPSPFCLLDEADSALDEKNVDRYVGLVREYAKTTQFLVITHNKRTMTAADILYGVTMQTPGVSKRVTVNLEQIRSESGEVKILGGVEEPPAPAAKEAPAPESTVLAGVGAGGGGGGGGGR